MYPSSHYVSLANASRAKRDAYLEREPNPSNTAQAEHFEAEALRFDELAEGAKAREALAA